MLIILVYFIGVFYRVGYGKIYRNNLFTSESALRFNYAKMISEGESLPSIDYKAQYPEGLEIYSRNPVFMEYAMGYLYKILNLQMPFSDFIRLFIPIVASLSIIAVYLVVKGLSDNALAGLISALFYAVNLASVTRACDWEFVHETFALPFIFFHILFFIKALRKKGILYSIISVIFLFLALASWKISQFYFFLYVIFVSMNFVLKKKNDELYKSFAITLIFAILASLTIPFLKDRFFFFSYPMIISYSLLIAYFIKNHESRLKVRSIFIFFASMILFISILPRTTRYSHVYGLLFYKFLFLGRKPVDPTLLPFEVRALWLDPFTSPSLFELIYCFFPLILLVIIPLGRSLYKVTRRTIETTESFITYNIFVFFFIYLFVRRLRVFFVFFLIIMIGYLVIIILRSSSKYSKIALLLVILCLFAESGKTLAFHKPNPFTSALNSAGIKPQLKRFSFRTYYDVNRDLFNWIKKNTGENEVILTHFQISPMIRAYTNRAVNLISLFESWPAREKVREFLYALYDSEDSLYGLCQKYKAQYVVYSADTLMDESLYSWRYLANSLSINEEMTAYKMHFFPKQLKYFNLLYENDFYRIYKVFDGKVEKSEHRKFAAHPLIYRYSLLRKSSGSMSRFYKSVETATRFYILGNRYSMAGNYEKAHEAYNNALKIIPEFSAPYSGLGLLYELKGETKKAIDYYKEYIKLDPEGRFFEEVSSCIEKLND